MCYRDLYVWRESLNNQMMQVCASVDLEDAALRDSPPAGILDALTSFRMRVRSSAKKLKAKHALEECDRSPPTAFKSNPT